jgi:hypothetical protein
MYNWWPESLGLPDNSSLAQLLSGTWGMWNAQNPPSNWLPAQPADLSGVSVSVTSDGGTGSILTITTPLPSGGITVTSGSDPGWDPIPAGIMAQIAGAAAAAGAFAVCGAFLFGLPTNDSGWAPEWGATRPWTKGVCNAAVTAAWASAATDVGNYLTTGDAPTTGTPWHAILGAALGGAYVGYGFPYAGPLAKALQYAWIGLYVLLGSKVSRSNRYLLEYLTPYLTLDQWNGLFDAVDALGRGALQQLSNPVTIARQLGVWTPVASGYVGNVPTGGAVTAGSGQCMDAYGSNGDNEPAAPPAVPGHPVAINVCNGNPSQVFNFWPNGQIEIYGLCMDDDGDSNSSDTPVVNLQLCDGGYTQLWYENGAGEIVNAATGNCLDDPQGNTTPGTQLIAYPCNGGANQLWAPPNGTGAVTGFGPILSVQAWGAYHLCMMPQTTLANPVGSNIITELNPSNNRECTSTNLVRMWAVGSNGTLMANGTNALCMDSDGPATTGPGGEAAYFVQLQGCDGSQSQVWHVVSTSVGPALQNAGDGLCINTPSGQLSAVVSMVVASCASFPYPGELWRLPGFSAPSSLLSGGPCDIYLYYGTPCGAAYSMDRALYSGYGGPLYQVKRASDGTTKDIGLIAAGGDVNASQQDSFCAGTTCTITEIYDQSPDGNNLTIEQGGGTVHTPDQGAVADALPVKIGGKKAYGLDIEQGTGYRDDGPNNAGAVGIAQKGAPEGMYMVASGTHVNYQCCFDFGNVETNNDDNGAGRMDAVNLTTWCGNNNTFPCSGGPSVEADLENGQWTGSGPNTESASNSDFVTAVLNNDGQSNFELEGGNSESGGLTTFYDGALPKGYQPMDQEGGIVLGTGGDNSNSGVGSFFEGVMTTGFPSAAADKAVQANIVAAGYSGSTSPVATAAPSAAGQAVVHDGYSSVYTVDSANGHLQESYLPAMGDDWSTQDLSAAGGTLPGTPPVMPGTQPVSVFHCGYTSVYTVDASNGDLQETYLPAAGFPGDAWHTQDLTATYNTPPTDTTPTAVVHSTGAGAGSPGCDGYTSVYTVNRNGDLQETYLPNQGFPGDDWHTQDLSAAGGTLPGAPQVLPGTAPVAIVHCGFTSVYTVDAASKHLQETYLPAIGGSWKTQDLSANYNTPPTDTTPAAVVHSAGAGAGPPGCDAYTSVYTVDQGSRDLQETYLPNQGFPGDDWHTQDLSATGGTMAGTPPVAPGTAPVALVHMGYTSVYTVDQGSGDLRETYLPAIGGSWKTQDLTAKYLTPVTDQTPIVLLHPDTSGNLDWASVFTIGEFNAHLQETYLPNTGFPGDPWVSQDLTAKYHTPPVYMPQSSPASWSVAHGGYTSAYTVDASSRHLQETYLPAMGDDWQTQDLSATGGTLPGTPPVMAGTQPAALVHDGYTSVYTVDNGSGDLRETYLPAAGFPGDLWHTQDLSATGGTLPGTPPVSPGSSPTAVFHDGYISVYTVDENGDLQETYLPAAGFPGDAWHTQDLSASGGTLPGTPPVMHGTSPVAIVHDGYVSVYTVDANGDLQESFLPWMGDSWSTQDLTAKYNAPKTHVTPTAVFHDGYTSVYTVDENGDLQESFLPAMGDSWSTQDLTAKYNVPQAINVAPAALYHDGYTSVYYLTGPDGHLAEAYLPAISGPWKSQDLSANYLTRPSVQSPSPLVHYDTSGGLTWASVYTADASTGDVRETYLPDDGFPGDSWVTQDLSAKYHAPPAAPPGGVMYSASSGSEYLGYARTIQLEYAGSENGDLLATFEHEAGNGNESDYEIQRSTDHGATWSALSTVPGDVKSLAPFLYEFPRQLGGFPAGTLMLLGSTRNGSDTDVAIREWLSFDHGANWTAAMLVQSGGGLGDGVYEPFVTLDSSGNLAMFFSDERQNSTYSQFIGEVISTDGGLTWSAHPDGSSNFGPGEIKVVASPFPADRPGMATVTRMGFGGYALSYEMCGPQNCSVHIKTSADGDNWGSGASDLGTVAETSNGLFLQVSPVITWGSYGGPDGKLYLTGHREVSASGSIPQNQTVILTNTNGGNGPWSWMPAPAIPTAGASTSCNTNYSPDLLLATGVKDRLALLYTAAAAAGPHNCQEVADPITIVPGQPQAVP